MHQNIRADKQSITNRFWLLLLLSLFTSCTRPNGDWKTIELGRYLLDVPQDFNFKLQNGIDSQGGEITNDTIKLYTDFGYYTDTLFQTPQEYLNKRWFIFDAQTQFEKPGITYDSNTYPKIDVIAIRPSTLQDSDKVGFFGGSDYIATCKHENRLFNWPVKLPQDIKRHIVKIDTFNHLYRRLAVPVNGTMGETAVYMRDKRSYNNSIGNYYGVVIGTDSLSVKQQTLVLKIFNTLRPKTAHN